MRALHGTVVAFDETAGRGEVDSGPGGRYEFHCTEIADGTRVIAVGTPVRFHLRPGHAGRWEAGGVTAR